MLFNKIINEMIRNRFNITKNLFKNIENMLKFIIKTKNNQNEIYKVHKYKM
jgi:hypothetical protein